MNDEIVFLLLLLRCTVQLYVAKINCDISDEHKSSVHSYCDVHRIRDYYSSP